MTKDVSEILNLNAPG